MNLAGISYYSTNHPFLNRFKTAGRWTANWHEPTDIKYDPEGYPLSMPHEGSLEALFAVDPPGGAAVSRYIISYDGTATIEILSGRVINQRRGQITVIAQQEQLGLIVKGMNAAEHLRNVSVVREDQAKLALTGKIFNPEFISRLSGLSVIRFLDWGATNTNTVSTWNDRAKVDDYSWASKKGVPAEIMVALANETHTEPWFTLPARVDDDYVRNWSHLVAATALHPVHLEYMNEAWNWGFPNTGWAQEEANKRWLREFLPKGVWYNAGKPQVQNGMELFYGYRAAQIARIARDEFAKTKAVVLPVFAVQTGWHGLEQVSLDGVKRAKVGQPFAEYAVTTYYGDALSGENEADRAKVLSWARGGNAGLAAAFGELMRGGQLSSDSSLAAMPSHLNYHAKIAAGQGMKLVAYEGNLHFTAFRYPAPVKADIVGFMRRMIASPDMLKADAKMTQMAAAAGITRLALYSDFGPISEWGGWGFAESVYAPSARFEAMKAMNR